MAGAAFMKREPLPPRTRAGDTRCSYETFASRSVPFGLRGPDAGDRARSGLTWILPATLRSTALRIEHFEKGNIRKPSQFPGTYHTVMQAQA